jgi:hypothetical protein
MVIFAIVLERVLPALALPGAVAANGVEPAVEIEPNFQPYIFWAYGLVCALLFLFNLWTFVETKRLGERAEYLKERLASADRERRSGDEQVG